MRFDSYLNVMAMRDLTGLPVGVWTGFSTYPHGVEHELHAYPALIFGNRAIELASDGSMRFQSGPHEDINFSRPATRIDLRWWPLGRIKDFFDPEHLYEAGVERAINSLSENKACADFLRRHGALDLEEAVLNQDFNAARRHIEAGAFAHAYEFKPLKGAIVAGDSGFVRWLLEHHKPDPVLARVQDDAILKAFTSSILEKRQDEARIAETLDVVVQCHSLKIIPSGLIKEAVAHDCPLILEKALKMMGRPLCEVEESKATIQLLARIAVKQAAELKSERCLEVLLEAGFSPGNNARAQALTSRIAIEAQISAGAVEYKQPAISRKMDL